MNHNLNPYFSATQIPLQEVQAPPYQTFNWYNPPQQTPQIVYPKPPIAQTPKPTIVEHLPNINEIDYFGLIEIEVNISEDQLRVHDILEIALIIVRDGDVQMKKRWLIQPKISQEIHQLSKVRSGLTVELLKLDGNSLGSVISEINSIIQKLQLSRDASNFVFVTLYEQTFQNYLLNAFEYFKVEDIKFFKTFVSLNDSLPVNLKNHGIKTIMDGLKLDYERRSLRDSMTEASKNNLIEQNILKRSLKTQFQQALHKLYDEKSYDPIRGFHLVSSPVPKSNEIIKSSEKESKLKTDSQSHSPSANIQVREVEPAKDDSGDKKRKLHPNVELYRRIENKYLTTNEEESSFKETHLIDSPKTTLKKTTGNEKFSSPDEKYDGMTDNFKENVLTQKQSQLRQASFFNNQDKGSNPKTIDFIDFSKVSKDGQAYQYLLVLHVGHELGFILYEVGVKKSYNKYEMILPIHRKEIQEKSWLLTEAVQKLEEFITAKNLNSNNCCAVTSVYPNSLIELQNKYKYFSGQNLPKLLHKFILIPELVGDYYDINTRPERPPLQFFVDKVGARCLLDEKIFMTICIIDKMSEKIHWTSKMVNYELKESIGNKNNRRQRNRRFKGQ